MKKQQHRAPDRLRDISFQTNYIDNAHGSCLAKMGGTWVLCTATIEKKVPFFLKNTGTGWVTAEYNMLPCSTNVRTPRDNMKTMPNGRTQEIQRLIGRSLRAAVNLEKLGERQIIIDCDVIQADGGTRVTSINGGFIALYLAIQNFEPLRNNVHSLITRHITAVSCGLIDSVPMLDLEFVEDSIANIDANFVMDSGSQLIEVQCTAEHGSFSTEQLMSMLSLATSGCQRIYDKQISALTMK